MSLTTFLSLEEETKILNDPLDGSMKYSIKNI